ncbi:hypothetical protein C8J56DRAFT_1047755 [Mycena floridula]|nr:hypothetical protein C8J56DRAFT_1047755 [Mycena floridula]
MTVASVSSDHRPFTVRGSHRMTGQNVFERAKKCLAEILKTLDDDQVGGPIPSAGKLQILREHTRLVNEAECIWDGRASVVGAVGFQFKARKLEGKALKLKEAVAFEVNIAQLRLHAEAPVRKYPDVLKGYEIFWCDRYRWLESTGYKLRRRYNPGWIPSWGPKSRGVGHEDALVPQGISAVLPGI